MYREKTVVLKDFQINGTNNTSLALMLFFPFKALRIIYSFCQLFSSIAYQPTHDFLVRIACSRIEGSGDRAFTQNQQNLGCLPRQRMDVHVNEDSYPTLDHCSMHQHGCLLKA